MKPLHLALAAAGGLAVTVYYFRRPFPYAFFPEDVWRIRYLCAESALYSFLARTASRVGLGSEIDLLRMLYRWSSSYPASTSRNGIYFEKYNVAGLDLVVYKKLAWVPVDETDVEILRPCLIYLHGGGYVFTSPLERDAHNRHFVEELDAVVVAVAYRRAPESVFPAAFLDCVAATKHIYENSDMFGIDKARITVCGDSAGGNLSAAVALKLRDEGLHFLKNQVLIYPSVQLVNFRVNSMLTAYPMMSLRDAIWCMLKYTGESVDLMEALVDNAHVSEGFFKNPGFITMQKRETHDPAPDKALIRTELLASFQQKIKNPYLCPLMARSLKNLPRTLLVLCEYDVLLDDGLAYEERLSADGVDVTLIRIPGYHGAFRDFQFTKAGKAMMEGIVKWLRVQL